MPDITPEFIAKMRELYIKTNGTTWKYEGRDADETYLVAAANALPVLIAEVTRLREALADIAHGPVGYWNGKQYAQTVISQMMKIASDALKGGGNE